MKDKRVTELNIVYETTVPIADYENKQVDVAEENSVGYTTDYFNPTTGKTYRERVQEKNKVKGRRRGRLKVLKPLEVKK